MPNDFQINFLNGLEMARSTQGAKLGAMQQAASMQYQISAKQMDFQMGLLKLRESQAAQAVEMRMAQDEHQLKLTDYAMRAKESELRTVQIKQQMETQNVAMHAGAAISDLENKLVLQGLDSSSPEFLLAQVSAVQQGVFANADPKIANMVGSTLTAKLRTTQEGFYNSGLEALEKVNASRTVSLGNEETGVTLTDRMLGAGDKAKLIAVADRFKRGAILGHEPSQRMYGEVMGLIDGVTAPAPGVKDAAKTATDTLRQEFIEPRAPGQAEGLKYPESSSAAIKQARMDWRSEDVALAGQYIEGARARLEEIQRQARASRSEADVAAAARAASALSDLEAAAKDDTGLPGFVTNSAIGRAFSLGGGAVYRQDTSAGAGREYETRIASPTLRQLENLPLAASPQALLDEISKIHQAVRSRRGLSREFVPY